MSNFNQFFRNQGAKRLVEGFFSNIDSYNSKAKLTNLTWKISDENMDKPSSYFVENSFTRI